MLKAWNEFLDKPENEGTEEEEHVDGELTQGPITLEVFQKRMRKKYKTYIDLFELIIPSNLFSIRKSEEVRKELNESLRKLASSVKSQYKQIRGRKGLALNSKIKKFHVLERHVQSVADLERENEQLKELNSFLREEIEEWKLNYENLEEEKREMFHQSINHFYLVMQLEVTKVAAMRLMWTYNYLIKCEIINKIICRITLRYLSSVQVNEVH